MVLINLLQVMPRPRPNQRPRRRTHKPAITHALPHIPSHDGAQDRGRRVLGLGVLGLLLGVVGDVLVVPVAVAAGAVSRRRQGAGAVVARGFVGHESAVSAAAVVVTVVVMAVRVVAGFAAGVVDFVVVVAGYVAAGGSVVVVAAVGIIVVALFHGVSLEYCELIRDLGL